jgi:hypothetical protein
MRVFMKDLTFFVITLCLFSAFIPAAAESVEPAVSVTASRSPATLAVDGNLVACEAYNIGGYNYFRIRDLAKALSGTEKQFDVTWDAANQAINLTPDAPYTEAGEEPASESLASEEAAVPLPFAVYHEGSPTELNAYIIGDSSYFRLRDIAQVFDFGVAWDEATRSISIDTAVNYITPYLGVLVKVVDESTADASGLCILSVYPNRPAELAGAQEGDIIVAFDGSPIVTNDDFRTVLSALKPGDQVEMVVYRNGEEITLDVTLSEKPSLEILE